MTRTEISEDFRAVGDVLALLGDKWSVAILGTLDTGTRRFGTLKRDLEGISQKTLAAKLRHFERDGLVSRTLYPTIPPRVDYELTTLGHELLHSLENLAEFALMHQFQVEQSRKLFDATAHIEPPPLLDLRMPVARD
jgi:DNA-binding HxlR family transcriptional regulator